MIGFIVNCRFIQRDETAMTVERIKRLDEKSRHLCRKAVGLRCIGSALMDFSKIGEFMASVGRVGCLLGVMAGAKCTAPVLLDHGDVSKSDAAKSWCCFFPSVFASCSSTFLRRILRNSEEAKIS